MCVRFDKKLSSNITSTFTNILIKTQRLVNIGNGSREFFLTAESLEWITLNKCFQKRFVTILKHFQCLETILLDWRTCLIPSITKIRNVHICHEVSIYGNERTIFMCHFTAQKHVDIFWFSCLWHIPYRLFEYGITSVHSVPYRFCSDVRAFVNFYL